MSLPRLVAIAPGSPAERAGLLIGDEIITLNGEEPRDVIRFRLLADESCVELELRRGGMERSVVVNKRDGEPLGAEIDAALFDRVRTCDNHCPFCFIYQLPKGMRRSLYQKDDDYRLSFLYGNFTTLTRFTEADLERVLDEGLSPLYVSIHATDPEVRATLLRNRRGATSLRWLRILLDHGVEVHGQVVVCPGINDGEVFEDTMLGVLDQYPRLSTLGVVPLGVSAHNHEVAMREHTMEEAQEMLDVVERWQRRYERLLGRRVVFAADEYYLMADRPFPPSSEYEGFPQHENGIGMARVFASQVAAALRNDGTEDAEQGDASGEIAPVGKSGFFAWVDGAPAEGYRAPRREGGVTNDPAQRKAPSVPVSIRLRSAGLVQPEGGMPYAEIALLTGEYGARVLEPLLQDLSEHVGVAVRVIPVRNDFFGGNIAVTGLLTGADIAAALEREPSGSNVLYLLPDVTLSRGQFLDGQTPEDLPLPVEVVEATGTALVAALRNHASQVGDTFRYANPLPDHVRLSTRSA